MEQGSTEVNKSPSPSVGSNILLKLVPSPVHDHSGAHCIMKILDGELEETQYEWPSNADGDEHVSSSSSPLTDITDAETKESSSSCNAGKPLTVSKRTNLHPNQVAYIHGNTPDNFFVVSLMVLTRNWPR